MFESFEKYLIYLGIRSNEYTYDLEELFDNLDELKITAKKKPLTKLTN